MASLASYELCRFLYLNFVLSGFRQAIEDLIKSPLPFLSSSPGQMNESTESVTSNRPQTLNSQVPQNGHSKSNFLCHMIPECSKLYCDRLILLN